MQVDHQCKNRRRTTSGSVTTSCPSPLVPGSESSITGSDEEEAMEDDSFRDDASSEDASIEDVFDVTYEFNDLKQPAIQLLLAEDMGDVNILLHEIQQSDLSLGEWFSGTVVDHNYSAADCKYQRFIIVRNNVVFANVINYLLVLARLLVYSSRICSV